MKKGIVERNRQVKIALWMLEISVLAAACGSARSLGKPRLSSHYPPFLIGYLQDETNGILELELGRIEYDYWGTPAIKEQLLLLKDSSGKEVKRFAPKDRGYLTAAIPLDSTRVICNLRDDANGRRRYHVGVWNIRDDSFRVFEDKGSCSPSDSKEVSGISPKLDKILSIDMNELVLHDLKSGKSTVGFMEYRYGARPRFSPDGLNVAFLVSKSPIPDYKSFVIYNLVSNSRVLIDNKHHSSKLYWSPSGKYLARIGNDSVAIFDRLGNCLLDKSVRTYWEDRANGAIVFEERGYGLVWNEDEKKLEFHSKTIETFDF